SRIKSGGGAMAGESASVLARAGVSASSLASTRDREVRHRVGPRRELERHPGPRRGRIEPLRHDPPRLLEGIERLEIRAGQRLARDDTRWRYVAPFQHELAFAIQVAVQHQRARVAVL